MFANMSLKFKLIGSFCIVAAILCVVGVVGYSGVSGTNNGLNALGNDQLPNLTTLTQLQEGQLKVRILCNAMMNPHYPKDRLQSYSSTMDSYWKDLDEAVKKFDALPKNAEDEAEWKECTRLYETYRQEFLHFDVDAKAYVAARTPEEANRCNTRMNELGFSSFGKAAVNMMAKINAMTEDNIKEAYEAYAVANAVAERSVAMTMIFAIAGVLSALAFGIFLSLNISRKMNSIATAVAEGAGNIAAASTQVASSAQSVASGSQEQAASIEETSSSLEELASMTKQNADNTKTAASLMDETKKIVNRAAQGTESMDSAMKEIKSASDQTSKIIKTIDEIAFQTNLLALNAAVEAARAGEAGKGFAVVAEEVRNLAMRAAEAAKNTGSLIEENVNRVAGGVQIVDSLKTALGEVTTSSGKVASLVNEIAAASDEQSKGIEQINVAVTQMNQVTQGNAANAEESASASEEMSGQAESMSDLVSQMLVVINGNSGSDAVTHRTHTPSKAVTSVHKMTAKLAAKPVIKPMGKKPTAPEKVIPLDEHEELGKF